MFNTIFCRYLSNYSLLTLKKKKKEKKEYLYSAIHTMHSLKVLRH